MANKEEVVDLDKLSLEEIKQLADEEAAQNQNETEETIVVQQRRDDQGRFLPKGTLPGDDEDQDEPEDEEEIVYRREIDLGDGAGKEVFEAESIEELLDKIVDAKLNATRKIREQQEQIRKLEAQKTKPSAEPEISADEEFVLSQEMMSNPSQAVKKIFKKMTGMDISELPTIKQRSDAYEQGQKQQAEYNKQEAASRAWVQEHPEYIQNEANTRRMVREINIIMDEARQNGEEFDYNTLLEKAYSNLTSDGLLQIKNSEDVTTEKASSGADRTRIAKSEEVTTTQRVQKKASSLSSRTASRTAPKTELSEDDLYSMPMDKLRDLANRQQ